jgi:hypothetical protein
VRVAEAGVEGEAIDLRDDGALLVLTSSGIRPVLAGDVTLVSGLAL